MSSAFDICDQGVRFRGTVERPALVHYGHRGLKATLAPHWAVPPIGSSACAGAHVQYKYKYKYSIPYYWIVTQVHIYVLHIYFVLMGVQRTCVVVK